jgi:flagellar biosynthesis/type III secretory pathway chaperone
MKLLEITKQLTELYPALAGYNGFVSCDVVNKLLALLESCYSTAEASAIQNQHFKDEINRLKGEDGKPQINPNVNTSYSTEQERKKAEDAFNPPAIGFKLSQEKLKALSENGIPESVLEKLSVIKNKKFTDGEFITEVTKIIGKEQTEAYGELLQKYGRYKKRNRKSKVVNIEIDREQECKIDKSTLPPDAVFMYYEDNIVQDIIIESDNVLFKKEVYYSPSQHKTFMAKVPDGYEGGFGPGIKAEIINMKYINNMSEPKIVESLQSHNTIISPAYVSNRLTAPNNMQPFIDEKNDLFQVALEVSPFIQIDDTGCRVNGTGRYVQILCNDFFTAFFTVPRKDRLTVLDILRNFEPRCFIFNNDTFDFLEIFNVSSKLINKIRDKTDATVYDEGRLNDLLNQLFPNPKQGKNLRLRISEAAAIAHYHQGNDHEMVNILVADDAPQFKLLTAYLVLCWIHMGRHIKKLNPIVPKFRDELEEFQKKFWSYYSKLKEFKKSPDEAKIKKLDEEFDELFSTSTNYPDLNERIEKIAKKKENLLTVLKYPEVPLHNNASENGARVQKRREDISLQTKSKAGTIAKDAMMTIVETCKKLNLNSRTLIRDRIQKINEFPKLADVIRSRASG